MEYMYQLERYTGNKSRHTCPSCGGKKEFTRYVNTDGEYLSDKVGKCNRENKCTYHYKPRDFFIDNPTVTISPIYTNQTIVTPVTPIQYLPMSCVEKTTLKFIHSDFHKFLRTVLSSHTVTRLWQTYYLGANKDGYTVFWQIDLQGNVRQGKVIKYDPVTGKRCKGVSYFVGKKILNDDKANLQQCFFGEFNLCDKEKPVAIVEGEKTAVIASAFYPEYIWLAKGAAKGGCKWTERNVAKVLDKRKVVLFPDLGMYDEWTRQAKLLQEVASCTVYVSDLLEKNATEEERAQGLDLADYYLKMIPRRAHT